MKFMVIPIKKIILILVGIFVTVCITNYSYAGRPPPSTFFVAYILDSKSGKFPGSPCFIRIIEQYKDEILESTVEITQCPQQVPLFVYRESRFHFIAYRDGYMESEPFIYIVQGELPKEGMLFNHTFYLTPLEQTKVYINVKNQMNQPLKDVSVSISAIYANESFVGKTNEKGIFSFSTRFENFKIYVSAEGYKPFEGILKVLHNVTEMTYNVVLEYLSTVRLTIEVKDEAWRYIPRANVTLTSEYGSFSKVAEKGVAEFEVPTAKYKLTVKKEGYQPYEEILNLSKPLVGGKVIQLMKIPIPWWQQYWYAIVGVAAIVCIIPLLLMVRRRHIKTIGVTGKSHTRNSHEAF
jgi:hypothetical protein